MYVNVAAKNAVKRVIRTRLTPRRAYHWTGFVGAWYALRGLTEVGESLDRRLYPRYRDQEVVAPVFIFANGRSGTTMLHRLMSMDDERFAGFKLYQSVFNSVAYQKLIQAGQRSPLAPVFGRGVDWINATFFSGWEGIHELGIDKEEEDEALFVSALETPSIALIFPFLDDWSNIGWLDDNASEDREAFLDFYEKTLKKHLFASGQGRRFINKNVFFTPRVKSILKRFPDAHLIYMVRHPYKAIPSFLNMFHEKWVTHSPEIDMKSDAARELVRMAYAYYRYALSLREEIPDESLTVVRYEDLVKDPRATVERIYAKLDLTMSSRYERALDEATSKQRKYKSAHTYSLEQFGLTEDEVYAELSDLFAAYGYDR